MSNKIYPVVKWIGGKRQLIDTLHMHMPVSYTRYFEPFIGGGALFFSLQPHNGYIADDNEELINMYTIIRDNVDELIDSLRKHEVSKEYYLAIRKLDRLDTYRQISKIERASRFIYLNKTCFNGIYSVNSNGYFNVPFGYYTTPLVVDEANLKRASELLKTTDIVHTDFSTILTYVQKNDFVYFDPPYIPLNKTSKFTSYTKQGFSLDMHYILKDICDELDRRGVFFMLSNSDTKLTHELYKNYDRIQVFASRVVNASSHGRGKITELLIRNYA